MIKVASGRKAAKKTKPKFTSAQLERAVLASDANKNFSAHDREEIKLRLKRARKNLERDVPSRPWFDAKWEDDTPFPPGGDQTLMQCCSACGRYTPPNCIGSSGACDDCRFAGMSPEQIENIPSSHSSVNLAKLKASRQKNGRPYTGGI